MSMNLLITGASGQLGQNICSLISPLFDNVYELSRHDSPSFDNFKLVKADLECNDLENKIDAIIQNQKVDMVLHMAASISSGYDNESWNSNIQTNIMGTHRLLDWAVKNRVRAFYFISTYIHLDSDEQPFSIYSKYLPRMPYAVAKLVNEVEIADICENNNISYAIFRLPSYYGSKPVKIWTVLPAMVKSALSEGSIKVYGKGSRMMNFVHTNDIARAIAKTFNKNATGIFHVASKLSISMLDLAKIITNYLPESKIEINNRPDPQDGKRFDIDISETIKQIDWEPEIEISKGVEDVILSVKNTICIE